MSLTGTRAPLHVIEAALDAAWPRYEQASQRAALSAAQRDLFDTSHSEAREWGRIVDVLADALPSQSVYREGRS